MVSRDAQSCAAGVEQFLKFVLEMAKAALDYERLSKARLKDDHGQERLSERCRLERAIKAIEEHSGSLINAASYAEDITHVSLFHPMLNVLVAAYDAGMVGNASLSAQNFYGAKHGGDGGKKTGELLKAEADERWRIAAKQMGEDMLKHNPRLPISEIATGVKEVCPGAPEFDEVYKYLRQVLPSKKKRKQELAEKKYRPARLPSITSEKGR